MPFLALDTHEVPPNVKLDTILKTNFKTLLHVDFGTRLKKIADDIKRVQNIKNAVFKGLAVKICLLDEIDEKNDFIADDFFIVHGE